MAPKNNRVTNSLVALSSAAVLSVYGAGFVRTKAAADRFNVEADERRPGPGGRGGAPVAAPQHPAEPANEAAVTPAPAALPATPLTKTATEIPKSDTGMPEKPAATKTKSTAVATDAPAATTSATSTENSAAQPAPVAAPVPVAAPEPVAAPAPAPSQWKDGTYTGWGTSRHGDIQAFVTIENGRIAQTGIAQCLTRYSCSWIAHLPAQVVSRQSPEVDWVSGATQSVNAFYYAIVEALNKAK